MTLADCLALHLAVQKVCSMVGWLGAMLVVDLVFPRVVKMVVEMALRMVVWRETRMVELWVLHWVA